MNTEELRVLIRTVADTSGAKQTQAALRQTQQTAKSITAAGVAGGLAATAADSLANSIGNVVNVYGSSIQVAREHERIMRATSASYGQMASDWVDFAQQLSAATGVQTDAVLQSAINARSLQSNFALSVEQSRKLLTLAADLSRVRGIDLEAAFGRIESAMRGEAEASEYLGVTLGDVFMKTTAANGAFKNTWERMTELEKAQARYNELLRQSVNFTGLATDSTNSLDAAFRRTEKSVNSLQLAIGELAKGPTIGALTVLGNLADSLKGALGAEDPGASRFFKFLPEFLDELKKGGALVPSFQKAAEAATGATNREQMMKDIAELNKLGVGLLKQAQTEAQAPLVQAARIAFMDQVQAAVQAATDAQREQLELQQRSVDLAAQEAQIRLGMLPAQEAMAELQRRMTEQQIRARQAALPATEALEDLHYLQQRAQLVSQNRNIDVQQRIAARRELRGIGRALPGAELAALEAGRGVTLAGRAAERLGMEQQLFEISTQRQLQQITEAQTANGYLSAIAAQKTQAIELTINMSGEGFEQEVFKQLVEANNQAQGPTVVKLSGVRR